MTDIGQAVPDDAIALYDILVPDGNDEVSDPHLDSCVLTTVRRIERSWPLVMTEAPVTPITFAAAHASYSLSFDIVSWDGERPVVDAPGGSRTPAGFDLRLVGSADNVLVRWVARGL